MQAGFSKIKIASLIGVHKTTIYRELHRNMCLMHYIPRFAQMKADGRRKCARKKICFTNSVKRKVEYFLKLDFSPEQISGHLAKERVGDWEIDTLIGKNHKGAFITAVERKTKYTRIRHVSSRKADLVAETIIQMLRPYQNKVFTITVDNGREFCSHKRIQEALDTKVYFARPYHAWERGIVENTNGLIRQ